MKPTLELPDGLMQRIGPRTVHRNQKLKDAIVQLLELGTAAASEAETSPRAPKPVRLKSGRLNIGDIEAAPRDLRDLRALGGNEFNFDRQWPPLPAQVQAGSRTPDTSAQVAMRRS